MFAVMMYVVLIVHDGIYIILGFSNNVDSEIGIQTYVVKLVNN